MASSVTDNSTFLKLGVSSICRFAFEATRDQQYVRPILASNLRLRHDRNDGMIQLTRRAAEIYETCPMHPLTLAVNRISMAAIQTEVLKVAYLEAAIAESFEMGLTMGQSAQGDLYYTNPALAERVLSGNNLANRVFEVYNSVVVINNNQDIKNTIGGTVLERAIRLDDVSGLVDAIAHLWIEDR